MTNVISTKLFETDGVCAFKIPPGSVSLSAWNVLAVQNVWQGSLRVYEQEVTTDGVEVFSQLPGISDESSFPFGNADPSVFHKSLQPRKESVPPYTGLRLKLELYNTTVLPPTIGSLTSTNKDVVWAEVWYNPQPAELDTPPPEGLDYTCVIANDGCETIQITENPKYYKLITQLPGLGYHVVPRGQQPKTQVTQVALGLKFDDNFSAVSFAESLGIYKRRFRNFEEQYRYEARNFGLNAATQALAILDPDEDDDHAHFYDKNSNLFDTSRYSLTPSVDEINSRHTREILRLDDDSDDETNDTTTDNLTERALAEESSDDADFGEFVTST